MADALSRLLGLAMIAGGAVIAKLTYDDRFSWAKGQVFNKLADLGLESEPDDVRADREKREAEEKERAKTPEGEEALRRAVQEINRREKAGEPVMVDRGNGPKPEVLK